MRFKTQLLAAVLLAAHAPAGDAVPATYQNSAPLEWSGRLAKSEIARRGKTLFKGGGPKARWEYTSGLFAHSLLELGKATGDETYSRHAVALVSSFIAEDGTIATYRMEDYNIDLLPPGRVALDAWETTRDPRYKTAAATLRKQLETHPRTSDGGFWHKQRYPWQMWLDGLYMGSPFLAQYGKTFQDPAAFDEVVRQITLMDRHAYDPKSGLFHHAWDEKRVQPWADKQTGHSPCFWGRAVGWYAMALVDCLDHLPPTHEGVDQVSAILRKLAAGVLRHQDPKSSLWWQVMDQGGREGNYLETTASAMFIYAFAKGINRGYLDRATFLVPTVKAYEALVRDCTRTDDAGALHLTRCCEVAGLGFTSASGRPRDGTFEYYISEPIIENDLKGVGPFILAGIEMARLADAQQADAPVRGWDDLERVLSAIRAPEFSGKEYPITAYGAKPGADAADAIRSAIEACHAAGGGRVVIPAGEWLTGPIHLKSGVNLRVDKGAIVRFSTTSKDYPPVFTRWEGMECMNHSALIYALDQENIAVTGEGTLDGGATWDTWWAWNDKNKGKPTRQVAARERLAKMAESDMPVERRVFGEGSFLRPNFIQFVRCRNILIEGVAIERSPMWILHPVLSGNITVRKVRITSHGPNNDGCDPESCQNVLIEDCVFDTGDDCIAVKSGRNRDGRRVNAPSENIIVRRCVMKDGHGGVVLGSEVSGGVRNVFIEDCEMDSPNLDRALRFKSNAMRGGVIENIFMRRVNIGRVTEAVLTIDLLYEEGSNGDFPPTIRNVVLRNITSKASPRVLWVRGFERAVVEGISLEDCRFEGLTQADVIEHAGSIRMNHVILIPGTPPEGRNSVGRP
ncbi:MAG: glycoside hydrolase family 88 protein [Verrucomicrobia bacterium]|nr:glycoside hydrolase family 88 protein [Verrucomicrobiota bacterium]